MQTATGGRRSATRALRNSPKRGRIHEAGPPKWGRIHEAGPPRKGQGKQQQKEKQQGAGPARKGRESTHCSEGGSTDAFAEQVACAPAKCY